MTIGPLGLSGEDYWGDPYRHRHTVLEALSQQGSWGYALDAPPSVSLGSRATVPVVGARRVTLAEDASVNFEKEATLSVVRLESHETFVGPAFRWEPPLQEPSPEGEPVPPPQGVLSALYAFELRERIPELPWREGTILCTLLVRDQSSNRVKITLTPETPLDPAVEDFISVHRAKGYPRAVFPPHGEGPWPSYREGDPHPPPEEPDLVLALDTDHVPLDAPRCVLRGSVTRPALARERVRPFDPHEDRFGRLRGAGWVDVGDPDATAVLPVTVVLIGQDDPGPFVFTLQVPAYDPLDEAEDAPLVRASFAVELFSLPGMPQLAQTYHVWAFSGEELGGPLPLTLGPA